MKVITYEFYDSQKRTANRLDDSGVYDHYHLSEFIINDKEVFVKHTRFIFIIKTPFSPSINALNFGYNKSELEMSVLNSCWLGVPDKQLSFNRAR